MSFTEEHTFYDYDMGQWRTQCWRRPTLADAVFAYLHELYEDYYRSNNRDPSSSCFFDESANKAEELLHQHVLDKKLMIKGCHHDMWVGHPPTPTQSLIHDYGAFQVYGDLQSIPSEWLNAACGVATSDGVAQL